MLNIGNNFCYFRFTGRISYEKHCTTFSKFNAKNFDVGDAHYAFFGVGIKYYIKSYANNMY